MIWPDWWVYIVMAVSVFMGCLLLNYIVNKINEVQLEERLIALQLKSPEGRVTQVQVPLLERGETNITRPSLPTIKKSQLTHEIKTLQKGKDNLPISESQIEKIITKPIFLGSIYRSPELIERRTSNCDIAKADRKQSVQLDENYYTEILSELLDRVMDIINSVRSQTDFIKTFTLNDRVQNDDPMSSKSHPCSLNVKDARLSEDIIMNELLDSVMKKVDTAE